MVSRSGITIFDGIGPVLDYMVISGADQVRDAMEKGKGTVEEYARFNAPWADRSGAARAGLTASVFIEGGEVVLELAHTVDYGIWLETIKDGQYAIIMPTLEALGPEIIQDAGGGIMRAGGTF